MAQQNQSSTFIRQFVGISFQELPRIAILPTSVSPLHVYRICVRLSYNKVVHILVQMFEDTSICLPSALNIIGHKRSFLTLIGPAPVVVYDDLQKNVGHLFIVATYTPNDKPPQLDTTYIDIHASVYVQYVGTQAICMLASTLYTSYPMPSLNGGEVQQDVLLTSQVVKVSTKQVLVTPVRRLVSRGG